MTEALQGTETAVETENTDEAEAQTATSGTFVQMCLSPSVNQQSFNARFPVLVPILEGQFDNFLSINVFLYLPCVVCTFKPV